MSQPPAEPSVFARAASPGPSPPTTARTAAVEPPPITSQLLPGEPDLYDLIAEYVHALPAQIADFHTACRNLDWQSLRTLVHRLKGAGGAYGYPELSAVASKIEKSFTDYRIDDILSLLRRLESLAQSARAGLNRTPR